jgi:hypothetical protein
MVEGKQDRQVRNGRLTQLAAAGQVLVVGFEVKLVAIENVEVERDDDQEGGR